MLTADDDKGMDNINDIILWINRTVTMLTMDMQFDMDEKVEGNDWEHMNIDTLIRRVTQDFEEALAEEYSVMRSEGRLNEEEY
tara:strand:- start:174 stop:422 length:249 start_codon:yes stop_codon:yes gene_type:complete